LVGGQNAHSGIKSDRLAIEYVTRSRRRSESVESETPPYSTTGYGENWLVDEDVAQILIDEGFQQSRRGQAYVPLAEMLEIKTFGRRRCGRTPRRRARDALVTDAIKSEETMELPPLMTRPQWKAWMQTRPILWRPKGFVPPWMTRPIGD
jgi:hypothetical protein